MKQDELVRRRIEVKHVVPAAAAARIRARIAAARPGPGTRRMEGWAITTYFDLADRRLSQGAILRPETSLKLRAREYFSEDGVPGSPFLWFEIKERDGEATRKSRFQLHRRMLARFLEGDRDIAEILTCQAGDAELEDVVASVQRIDDLARSPLLAVGSVRYRRSSVQGGSPSARVTLDEKISYHLGLPALTEGRRALDRACLGPPAWEEGAAVVEVKHSELGAPAWCGAIAGEAAPAEYSKFSFLARLSLAEASAA